jgi:hypothetical protein
VRALLPFATHARHYMAVAHVKQCQAEWYKQPTGNEALAEAMLKMAKEQEKTRKAMKDNKRKRNTTDSDSEDESKRAYKCSQSLVKYTLDKMSHTHMTPSTKMQESAKRACQGFKTRGNYLVPGPVTDYCPQWMHSRTAVQPLPKDVPSLPTHAHWVAAWWGRAMTQLSCQGEAKLETVSLRELVQQFLNMNQLAVEANNRVAWAYDQQLWDNLVDRIRRHETDLDVSKEFTQVLRDAQKKITDQLASARQTQKTQSQGNATSSNSDYVPLDHAPTNTNTRINTNKSSKGGKGPKGGKGHQKGGKPQGGKNQSKGQSKGGKPVKTEK